MKVDTAVTVTSSWVADVVYTGESTVQTPNKQQLTVINLQGPKQQVILI